MKKHILDLRIVSNRKLSATTSQLVLTPAEEGVTLPEILPGQFLNAEVPDSKTTFLRRPISISDVDTAANTLSLVIRNAGPGTAALIGLVPGQTFSAVLPLGNSFPPAGRISGSILLVGGGVGIAPMLIYARRLHAKGIEPVVLQGAGSADDLLLTESFEPLAETFYTTLDGTRGTRGLVTDSEIFNDRHFDMIVCCGPLPMMKAVNEKARAVGTECYVSLENRMACGIGACLCCVENTVDGNKCTCTDGPIFNTKDLTW